MDIVKKNILSICCGAIALIALIASVWPMGGYQEDLEKELGAKKQTYANLEGLERKSRMMPTLDPEAKEAAPLGQFPSAKIIESGKTATEAVAAESKTMFQTAVTINSHGQELLVPQSLPRPRSPEAIAFREKYQRVFQEHLINQILKGTTPPTAEEIKAEVERLWQEEYAPRIFRTANGASNEASIKAQADEAAGKLPEQMRQRRAESSKVYVEPGAFDVLKGIAGAPGATPEPAAIWWAQVGLWVQQDIARAIADANAQASNVMAAPVKRLVRIEVPPHFVLPPGEGNNQRAPQQNPWEQPVAAPTVPQDADAKLPSSPSVSVTGRVSNPMFDVVHATLTVDLDAEMVPQFLARLGDGRFFTVLKADVVTIDAATMRAGGYYYGPKPVVQISLRLETLFMRAWTVQFMPDSVKRQLGIPLQPAGMAMH